MDFGKKLEALVCELRRYFKPAVELIAAIGLCGRFSAGFRIPRHGMQLILYLMTRRAGNFENFYRPHLDMGGHTLNTSRSYCAMISPAVTLTGWG